MVHTNFGPLGLIGLIGLYSLPAVVTLIVMIVAKVQGWYTHILTAVFAFFLVVFLAATALTVGFARGYMDSMPMFRADPNEAVAPAVQTPKTGMKLAVSEIPSYLASLGFVPLTGVNYSQACEKGHTCVAYWHEEEKTLVIVNDNGTIGITAAFFSGTSQEQMSTEVKFAKEIVVALYPEAVDTWIGANISQASSSPEGDAGGFHILLRTLPLQDAKGGIALDITISVIQAP